MTDVVIASAARTAVGAFNGTLKSLSAAELGAIVIGEVLKRARVEAKDVGEVIMGQVLTGATGMNPARQASIRAGLPIETPAWVVNMVCGSGLRSVALGFQSIRNGDASIVISGGQESMSQAPHAIGQIMRTEELNGRASRAGFCISGMVHPRSCQI